ncbi:MAG: sigma-54-dependent transcriptional regulator [Desulfovibrionales bacterium]
MQQTILIVDDNESHRVMLTTMIQSWGYATRSVGDGADAVSFIRKEPVDLVLMDVRMARMSGLEALKRIKGYNPAIPVLIMTAYSSVDSAVQALKNGAYDYLTKPLDFDVLKLTMERAMDHTRLEVENRALRQKVVSDSGMSSIIGRSAPMRELLGMVAMVAPSEATVLITGESGTGKELIAKALHTSSSRSKAPLVTVNCAALTETLLESELFGHEKGSFTGADKQRDGRFMQANKGTIFLDEIGEIAPVIQAKLLRVIQEREIQRVGSDRPIRVDVRIVAATNRDLKQEVEENRFREDLFYRLNVVTLSVPPLRDRKEDIPLLAQHFLGRYAEKNRKKIKGLTPRAMDLLLHYEWPGNVRELENAMERGVILAPGEYVTERELPLGVGGEEQGSDSSSDLRYHGESLEEIEREAILETLRQAGGNKSETARILKITRATLHKKLKSYGVNGSSGPSGT